MMTALSGHDEAHLVDIAVRLGLPDRRDLLISADVRAEIRTDPKPRIQLMYDLRWLAAHHQDRPDSPLVRWLRQAIQIADTSPDRQRLTELLERLPGTPDLDERVLARWRAFTRKSHEHTAPFARRGHARELDEIFIELDLDERVVDPEVGGQEAGLSLEGLLTSSPTPGRWIVLGEPGAGKSTLARHLAWRKSRPSGGQPDVLPAFLSLARLVAFDGHPFDLAEHQLKRRDGQHAARGLSAALRKAATRPGRLWVLFDGLDEVPPASIRPLLDDLRGWSQDWTGAAIVVLSRPAVLDELDPAYTRAFVRRLDDAHQRALLDRWFEARADAVWRHLQTHPRLRAEARNPLLLTLVALLARHDRSLPASRTEVYRQALDLLFERGHALDGTGVASPELARRVSRLLARRLTIAGGEAWTRSQLIESLLEMDLGPLLDPWARNPEAFLVDLGQNAGVLAPHDGREQPWRFLHRSLREMLTAEQIWSEAEASDDAEAHILSFLDTLAPEAVGAWGEPLAMLCNRLDDQLGFLAQLARLNLELALRAFPNLEGVDPEAAMEFLGSILGNDLDQLIANARRLGLPDDVIARALLGSVTPSMPPTRLTTVYARICELHGPPERVEFFGRAGRLDPPPELDWIPVPGGTTRLGAEDRTSGDPDVPAHDTTIEPFEMSATPLTVAHLRCWRPGFAPECSPDQPAGRLSWDEARLICAWLGARLPTENEWAHACRAGTQSRYWSGDTTADFDRIGWGLENSDGRPRPVMSHPEHHARLTG